MVKYKIICYNDVKNRFINKNHITNVKPSNSIKYSYEDLTFF